MGIGSEIIELNKMFKDLRSSRKFISARMCVTFEISAEYF